MFGFDMHILNSHTRTRKHPRIHYKRENHTTGIRKKKKNHRGLMSALSHKISLMR